MIQETLERYTDSKKMYSFEGQRGASRLAQLIKDVTGHDTIEAFLSDNSGAIDAVVEWMGKQNCQDWKDNLESIVGPDEDDEVGDLVPPEEIG